MNTLNNQYTRSSVWLADLGRGLDSEMSGTRPVLVLQNDRGNRYSSNVIVSPISTKRKAMPTHVPLDERDGIERESYVLAEHILTISKKRLLKKLSTVHPDTMEKVEDRIMFSCGIQLRHPSSYKKGE